MPPKAPPQKTTLFSFFKLTNVEAKRPLLVGAAPAPAKKAHVVRAPAESESNAKHAGTVDDEADGGASDCSSSGDEGSARSDRGEPAPSEDVRRLKNDPWVGGRVAVRFTCGRWFGGAITDVAPFHGRGGGSSLSIAFDDGTQETSRYPDRQGHVVVLEPQPLQQQHPSPPESTPSAYPRLLATPASKRARKAQPRGDVASQALPSPDASPGDDEGAIAPPAAGPSPPVSGARADEACGRAAAGTWEPSRSASFASSLETSGPVKPASPPTGLGGGEGLRGLRGGFAAAAAAYRPSQDAGTEAKGIDVDQVAGAALAAGMTVVQPSGAGVEDAAAKTIGALNDSQVCMNDDCGGDDEGEEDEDGGDGEENDEGEGGVEGLSEYELLRLERIKRNAEYLSSLGLDDVRPSAAPRGPAAGQRKKKKPSRPAPGPSLEPVRRSTRAGAGAAPAPFSSWGADFDHEPASAGASGHGRRASSGLCAQVASSAQLQQAAPEADEVFGDSDVLTYLIGGGDDDVDGVAPHASASAACGIDLTSFAFGASSSASRACGVAKAPSKALRLLVPGTSEPLGDGTKGRWYSLASDPRSGLLAAGGQGGKVAVFRFRKAEAGGEGEDEGEGNDEGEGERERGTNQRAAASSGLRPVSRLMEGGEGPVLAFKPHGSTWVSDVAFCGGSGASHRGLAASLLTAANDGCVALWDLTKQLKDGSPRPLGGGKQAWHRSGVFSMDARGSGGGFVVATGCKDGGVGLGTLGEGGDRLVLLATAGLDLGTVKGVAVRPFFPFGDASSCLGFPSSIGGGGGGGSDNDGGGGGGGGLAGAFVAAACGGGAAVILDGRCPTGAQGRLVISSAHGTSECHTVEWSPLRPLELLTAGLDAPVLRLWDIRMARGLVGSGAGGGSKGAGSPGGPLREFRGHVPDSAAGKRLKAIARPRFLYQPPHAASAVGCLRLAVQGEHCLKLTLYDAASGTVVSRGGLERPATALGPVSGFSSGPSSRGGGGLNRDDPSCGEPCVAVAYDDGRIALLVPGDREAP